MYAPSKIVSNSGAGRFGFGYGNAAGSPVGYAPVVAAAPAVQYQQYQQAGPTVQYMPSQQYQQPTAAVQYQQPGTSYGQAPQFLSPKAMMILKEFTTDHHWRHRSKQLSPMFDEAGNGAQGLNYPQLQKFYDLAGVQFFDEPVSHLLTEDIFERFDFNGDGMLQFFQAFKSLKCVLYEGFHEYGGQVAKPVELITPEQKGYTIIKELARGGQGAAMLASHPEQGKVVLKTYEKNNPNAGTLEEHIAEMEVLKELSNEEYIMHAYDIFQDNECVYCVNELMSGGDLEGLRAKTTKAGITLTQDYFKNIFKQTLLGLHHIHEHGLMHCDLKEPNVMIKNTDYKKPQVAIIDFGLASVCAGPGETGGTPGYVPPETNKNHIWYPKGDIFALGVAFFQLLADKVPEEKKGKLGVFQEGFRTLEDVEKFTATRPLPWHVVTNKYPGVKSWLSAMCSKAKKPRPRALQLLDLQFFGGDKANLDKPVSKGATTMAAPASSPAQKFQYTAPQAEEAGESVTLEQLGDWMVCEDAAGIFYHHAPTQQSFDTAPAEFLKLFPGGYSPPPSAFGQAPQVMMQAPVLQPQTAQISYAPSPQVTYAAPQATNQFSWSSPPVSQALTTSTYQPRSGAVTYTQPSVQPALQSSVVYGSANPVQFSQPAQTVVLNQGYSVQQPQQMQGVLTTGAYSPRPQIMSQVI